MTSPLSALPIINPYNVALPSGPASPISALAARRAANIAAFLAGPVIPAPAWVAATVYPAGSVVSLPSGQHIYTPAGGTSAGAAPVYSQTVLTGRPLVDNTVTWYGLPFIKATADVNAPTITTGANAAAVGLTETRIVTGSNPPIAQITGFGAYQANHLGGTYMSKYTFANGPAAGSGNSTTAAVTDSGQSAAFVYQTNCCDTEFYITDSKFGLTFSSSTNPIVIEIDGKLVQGNPTPAAGVGWCIAFDYNGAATRHRVKLTNNGLIDQFRGVAMTATGFMEVTDSPASDVMLLLGDSLYNTASPTATNGLAGPMGWWISKMLGMTSVVNCGIGGSGYAAPQLASANSFTTYQMLTALPNQTLLPGYNPSHILITSGFNDRNIPWAIVGPAALQTWQTARAMFPDAKITISDGFSQASGPDAAALVQAANLKSLFTTWGDLNSRFIQTIGASASAAMIQGTNNAGSALQLGNSCYFVGTDGTHPTPAGAFYLGAVRLPAAINAAWNGGY